MPKKTATSSQSQPGAAQPRYINPLTDFGFKRIFGTEANKDLLINFLEAVLNIDGGIKDLTYDNTERQGRAEIDRKAVFDLYCTTGKGERIIVEMQNVRQEHFKDRALYYASFPIQGQGEKSREWDFELAPVYSVNIVNFKFGKKMPADKYVSYVQLLDRDTGRVFCDKLTFVFMELPRFKMKESELQTDFDRWMYVLRHLSKLGDLPEPLRNRIFEKLFRVAEVLKMTPTERKFYDQSLKEFRDMYLIENEIKKRDARLKERDARLKERDAMLKEREAIIKKQNADLKKKDADLKKKDADLKKKDADLKKKDAGLKNTVRILLEAGIAIPKIAESTGLSIAEIEQIRKVMR